MFTKQFWKGLGERASKTAAQGFLYGTGLGFAAESISGGTGVAFIDIPWLLGLQSGAIMGLFSALTSFVNPKFTAGADKEEPRQIPA